MRRFEVLGSTAFRWAAIIAGAFSVLSLSLFAFVYWQTAGYERTELDATVVHEGRRIASAPSAEVLARLGTWLAEDLHTRRYGLLLDAAGQKLAGNMAEQPYTLPADGVARRLETAALDADGDSRHEIIRCAAFRLSDGRLMLLGLDTDELEHTRAVILRALGLGLIPMVLMALGGGALLGRRAIHHVTTLDIAIDRIMRGAMTERLPLRGKRDEFDRLARSINLMLDKIEQLLEDARGVGDSIAHDLRTPLMRARTRLERSRDEIASEAQFKDAIDQTLVWLDQTFAIIKAVLRIGEVEHGRRHAEFRSVALAPLMRELHDLYEPVADEKGIALVLEIGAEDATTIGDRDLLVEAFANLVDNALKFTPSGGICWVNLSTEGDDIVVSIQDDGPGILAEERALVLRRFFRSEQSRTQEGSGLGLALVAAVANLHGFALSIRDNEPGCWIALRCKAAPAASV